MPSPPVNVILNPESGAGRAGRSQAEVARELAARGVDFELHLTRSARHATELARNLATAGASIIVAAGGDGTVHDVANGIMQSGSSAALAVLPLGTGNDFAKVVPGARPLRKALDTLANHRIAEFDVGHATWAGGSEFFANGMGTGIDVEVVRRLRGMPALPGPVKYLGALLRALAVYDPIALIARTNGERLDRSVMMMAVGNGRCQGGGFYLTPRAAPDDGHLDLCVIAAIPLWQVPFLLPRVLRGTHEGHAAVTMRGVDRVRFETAGEAPLYFQLDGELREPAAASWIEVEIRRSALHVVTGIHT